MNTIKIKRPQFSMGIDLFVNPLILGLLKKHHGYISGGVITSVFTRKKINDVDIYFLTEDSRVNFMKDLKAENKFVNNYDRAKTEAMFNAARKKPQITYVTDNATSFFFKDKKYQVITAFYGEPGTVFDKYDFTINMGAYNPETKEFIVHEDLFEHLSQRRLVINIGTEYPISTVVRIFKYIRKGYSISGIELIKILLTVHHLDLKNFAELKKQLMGIDTMFLKPLTDFLSSQEHSEKAYDFSEFMKIYDNMMSAVLDDDTPSGKDDEVIS